MGIVHTKPGQYTYVKYYKYPFFKRWQSTRSTLVKPTDRDLKYFGELVDIVTINDQPIEINLEEEGFKTVDDAVFNLSIKLQVSPILDSSVNDDLLKCIPVYTINRDSEQDGLNCPKDKLENRLKPILSMLRYYKFSDLKEYLNTKETVNSETRPEPYISLRNKIETKAREILDKYNFQVYGLCVIDLYHPDLEHLNKLNDNHIAIIEYLRTHDDLKSILKKKEEDFDVEIKTIENEHKKREKELEASLTKINTDYEELKKVTEAKNKETLISIEQVHELAIGQLNENYNAKKRNQELNHDDEINNIEFEHDKTRNILKKEKDELDLLKDKNRAEIDTERSKLQEADISTKRKTSQNLLEKQLIELNLEQEIEIKKIEHDLSLFKERQKLPGENDINHATYSWDQIQGIMTSKYNEKLKEIENKIHALGLEQDATLEKNKFEILKLNKELEREFVRDDLKYELLKRIFEREIIFAYSQLKTDNQTEVVERLGKQLTNIVQAASGVVTEMKLYGLPSSSGEGNHSEGISTLLAGLYKVMPVFPEIGEALSELGIKWKDTEQNENQSNQEKP